MAKKEKNAIRKKKIIKAAAIIAGTIAAGVAIYHFGPAIIAHLLSQTVNPIAATSAISSCAATSDLARKLGNANAVNIGFKGTENEENIKDILNKMSPTGKFGDIIKKMKDNPNQQYSVTKIAQDMSSADAARFKNIARKLKEAGVNIVW